MIQIFGMNLMMEIVEFLKNDISAGIIAIIASAVAVMGSSRLWKYLQIDVNATSQINGLDEEIKKIKDAIKDINENEGPRIDAYNIGDDQFRVVKESIEAKLIKDTSQSILEDMRQEIRKESYQENLKESFGSTTDRLKEEITKLYRISNLNLYIGILITAFGLIILGQYVYSSFKLPNTSVFLVNFIPRLTLVVFIELYSYFFLNLYRKSMPAIREYQRELTNIENKYIALNTAIYFENNESILRVISSLCREDIFEDPKNTQDDNLNRDQTKLLNEGIKLISKALDLKK